jgi:Tol biopolymer transport system component
LIGGCVLIAGASAVLASGSVGGRNGRIAFDRLVNPSTGAKAVYTSNPDGTRARRLLPVNDVSCCAVFSPDGSKLVIPYPAAGSRIGTAIINPDGTGYRPFPIGDPKLNVGCGLWSPDGARLACETWDDANSGRDGVYTISSTDGSGLARLTTNPVGGHDLPGGYSPNGQQLVFARFDTSGAGIGLFIVNTDGSGEHRLTPKSVFLQDGNTGDWSPRGNLIIFSRLGSQGGSLWTIHADGTHLRELKVKGLACGTGVGCHEPRWSPNGKEIIFAVNGVGSTTQIYTIKTNGSGLKHVTSGDDPSWGTHPLTR